MGELLVKWRQLLRRCPRAGYGAFRVDEETLDLRAQHRQEVDYGGAGAGGRRAPCARVQLRRDAAHVADELVVPLSGNACVLGERRFELRAKPADDPPVAPLGEE